MKNINNIIINGNVTVEVTDAKSESGLNITENTTLGELIKSLNLGNKPYETPTPKKLRENAGDPVAHYPLSEVKYFGSEDSSFVDDTPDTEGGCTVYSNGYAVYDNGSGRTVLWLPDCTNFTYVFNKPKPSEEGSLPYKDTLPDGMLESLTWFTAVMLIGDHRIENNLMNRRSSRKGAKDYDTDDRGDKCGEAEEVVENRYRGMFLWNDGRFGEDPLDALIRAERNKEMLDAMTDKQREVFLLYYKDGYTQQQIADMLGLSQKAVDYRLDGAINNAKIFF